MKFLKGAAGVAAIAGAIASTSAGAVNISTDGVGEVAISPFYTTRNNWSTLINLTNTSDDQVVVKVRLHEARNSRDVLDFIVALSAHDVYTAQITEGANGPILRSLDQQNAAGQITCTVPSIVGLNQDPAGNPIAGTPLSTLGFDVTPAAATAADIDRLREGYIEFVVMGHATADANTPASTPVATAIENHDCATVDAAFNDAPVTNANVNVANAGVANTTPAVAAQAPLSGVAANFIVRDTAILRTARQFGEPTNSVKFNARLINGTLGVEAGIPVTTWANFFNPGFDPAGPNFAAPGATNIVDGAVDASANANCLVTRGDERIQSDGFFTDLDWAPAAAGSCQNLIAAQREFAYLEPSLADAWPPVAKFVYDAGNRYVEFEPDDNGVGNAFARFNDPANVAAVTVPRGVDALSGTIMRESILNEWSVNAAQGVATEWIATFPTKGHYVDLSTTSPQAGLVLLETNAEGRVALNRSNDIPDAYLSQAAPRTFAVIAPFENVWNGTNSCDEFAFDLYDRAEQSLAQGGVVISPTPSNARPSFCYESNVITFNGLSRLGTPTGTNPNRANIDTSSLANNAGWMDLTFDTAALTPRLNGQNLVNVAPTYALNTAPAAIGAAVDADLIGKPVIGFILKVRTFPNSTADQNFASANEHGYRTVLIP